MGALNNDTLMEVLARVRHSAGIEFIILIRKNICSGEIKGVRKSTGCFKSSFRFVFF